VHVSSPFAGATLARYFCSKKAAISRDSARALYLIMTSSRQNTTLGTRPAQLKSNQSGVAHPISF
jgi:hypothetical protein